MAISKQDQLSSPNIFKLQVGHNIFYTANSTSAQAKRFPKLIFQIMLLIRFNTKLKQVN